MSDRHQHQLYLNDVARRAEDRLARQLAEEAEWQRTGRIRCSDCRTVVTTRTLETLPEHRCTQRQARRRQAAECPVCDGTGGDHQIGCQHPSAAS